jgi:hypothetical protein
MKNKLTTIQFIDRSNIKHGNKYEYSKVNYTHNSIKVIITCKLHGDFKQAPNNHVRGQGCPTCHKENAGKSRIKTQEQYIEEVDKIHNYTYDYSKTNYTKCHEKIIIICKIHGDFEQLAHAHTFGQGCPKCGQIKKLKVKQRIKNGLYKKVIKHTICFIIIVIQSI